MEKIKKFNNSKSYFVNCEYPTLYSSGIIIYNCIIFSYLINDLTEEKGKIYVLLFLINQGTVFYMAYYSENLYFFKFIINKKLINE